MDIPFNSNSGFLVLASDLISVSNRGAIVRQLVGIRGGKYPAKKTQILISIQIQNMIPWPVIFKLK